MKGEFYKMDYEAWDEGTTDFSLELEGAYLRLCHQMYRRHGAIPNSEKMLCAIWRCQTNKARALLAKLIETGKIEVTSDGRLTNARVSQELAERESISRRRAAAGRSGGSRRGVGGESPGSREGVDEESLGSRSGVFGRNPLKPNGPDEALASTMSKQRREEEIREEEKREEKEGDDDSSPPPPRTRAPAREAQPPPHPTASSPSGDSGQEEARPVEQAEPLPPDPGVHRIVFEHGAVRLTGRQLRDWIEAFPNLDVPGELRGTGEWADYKPDWFSACASLLRKRNREARERIAIQAARPLPPTNGAHYAPRRHRDALWPAGL